MKEKLGILLVTGAIATAIFDLLLAGIAVVYFLAG